LKSLLQNSHNVTTLYFDGVYAGWEKLLLLTSDRHHDSPKCGRELELEHLKEAKAKGAYILDVGDCFDVMQGKFDPRRSYSGLRPEYKIDNYLDEIIKEAAKFYAPYADRFVVMGRGNHEMAILKHNGVDLTGNLVHRLNSEHGGHIQAGGYTGWLRLMFLMHSSQRVSIKIKYAHGFGGTDAPVTRGVIQTNRQAVYEPDANVVVNGHNHEAWYMPIARERISDKGDVYQDIQHHIRTGTYDDDYGDGHSGWHVESGKPPKPRGAVWLKLRYINQEILVEPILAIK
jgi:hypothetical protein